VTSEDVDVLEQNLAAQERANETADFDAFYVLDDQFHQAI
jgi:DNA-binding GntR family transcriptional regulator